jgi:hypothetical protein
VKKEIDRMLNAFLIFPVDSSNWISSIVIHNKDDIEDIRVYVDYRRLNSSF